MQIHSKFLFGTTVVGAILETFEVLNGSCAVWQQEYLLLAILLLLSLVARGHKILMVLAALGIIIFYGFEAYEQFYEGEQCSPMASALDPLLATTLLAAAGLALGHQTEDVKHKHS